VRSLLALRQQLLEATGQISQIGRHLIRTWQPDVCCLVLGAAHRAGHYLWNTSQLDGEKDGASTAVFSSPIEGSGSTWV
jgi:hypothetical protein